MASHDDVDRLIAAWQFERPELNVEPFHILSRVTRLARHLDIARREAFAAHDLETGEFDVLASLRRSGTPYNLSPSQLVNLLLVTSGTMTNRIDRLEAKGMVERLPDPNDGRGVIVRLTNAGKVAVDQAVTDLLDRERVLLDSVSAENQKVIADLLRQIVLPLDDANMPSDE